MTFPATRKAMEAAGYTRTCYTRCQACATPIEFWSTGQGMIPMETMPLEDSPAITHFAKCTDAARFRRRSR